MLSCTENQPDGWRVRDVTIYRDSKIAKKDCQGKVVFEGTVVTMCDKEEENWKILCYPHWLPVFLSYKSATVH